MLFPDRALPARLMIMSAQDARGPEVENNYPPSRLHLFRREIQLHADTVGS